MGIHQFGFCWPKNKTKKEKRSETNKTNHAVLHLLLYCVDRNIDMKKRARNERKTEAVNMTRLNRSQLYNSRVFLFGSTQSFRYRIALAMAKYGSHRIYSLCCPLCVRNNYDDNVEWLSERVCVSCSMPSCVFLLDFIDMNPVCRRFGYWSNKQSKQNGIFISLIVVSVRRSDGKWYKNIYCICGLCLLLVDPNGIHASNLQ